MRERTVGRVNEMGIVGRTTGDTGSRPVRVRGSASGGKRNGFAIHVGNVAHSLIAQMVNLLPSLNV